MVQNRIPRLYAQNSTVAINIVEFLDVNQLNIYQRNLNNNNGIAAFLTLWISKIIYYSLYCKTPVNQDLVDQE